MATDEASGQSLFIKNSSNKVLPIIRESMPPSNVGITYSPIAGINTSREPAMIPGFVSGRVTSKNFCHCVAPRSEAASNNLESNFSIDASVSYTHLTLPTTYGV